jgi:hypothetical protein
MTARPMSPISALQYRSGGGGGAWAGSTGREERAKGQEGTEGVSDSEYRDRALASPRERQG